MATAEQYRQRAYQLATQFFGDSPLRDIYMRMLNQESVQFDPNVVEGRRRSSAGAIGVAQFMPDTARSLGVDPLNFEQAVLGGARYLKSNIDQFGGDVAKGVAAYNAGGGNVQKAVQAGGGNWTNFLPGETKSYLSITMPKGATDPGVPNAVQTIPYANAPPPKNATQDPAKAVFAAVKGLAEKELGKRYAGPVINEPDEMRWGSPGWDCSSFVSGVYKQLGVTLTPYTDAAGSDAQTRLLKQEEARPGDIFFYRGAGTGGNPAQKYYHMGIYLGNGQGIDASTVGGNGVAVRPVNMNAVDFRRPVAIDSPEGLAQVAQKAVDTGIDLSAGGSGVTGPSVSSNATAGGAAMPTTPAFTYTSPYKDQIDALRSQQAKAQERLTALQAKGDSMTDAETEEFINLRTGMSTLTSQLADLIKIDQSERQFAWEQHQATVGQQANAATGIAGLRQQGFENSLGLVTAIGNIANTAFGQRLDLAGLINGVLEGNRAARLQELNTMIQMGQLDMAQAAMRFDVQERQQAAELAWTAQAAAKAGWIADEERKNALMFLPEGTHFQPGFEPNGAINATFAKWGIPPMVIGVAEVDRSKLEPENNMRRGAAIQTELGAPPPDFTEENKAVTASAERTRARAGTDVSLPRINPSELNPPAPMNADFLVDKLPKNPNTADIESFLQGLMNPDVGIPPGVSAGTPPPDTNPTNAPLGPNATGFITAEAAAHRDPARATVAAAATPAGLARRDAGLPVGDQNVMTPTERVIDPGTAFIANQANANNSVRGPTKPLDEDNDLTDTIWNWLTRKRSVKVGGR